MPGSLTPRHKGTVCEGDLIYLSIYLFVMPVSVFTVNKELSSPNPTPPKPPRLPLLPPPRVGSLFCSAGCISLLLVVKWCVPVSLRHRWFSKETTIAKKQKKYNAKQEGRTYRCTLCVWAWGLPSQCVQPLTPKPSLSTVRSRATAGWSPASGRPASRCPRHPPSR